jgi:hypothetical protein
VCWWETFSGYNLNIVYRVGKKIPADEPSRLQNYARAPEGHCPASILTVCGINTFCFQQLYSRAIQDDEIFEDVHPDTLAYLILKGQAEDYTSEEVCSVLGLSRDYLAEKRSVLFTLLRWYQIHWQQHRSFLSF